ncbi:THIOREDOXIN-LIKE 4 CHLOROPLASTIC [Salix purpurea]|uniref:THIOREDOXIN-LIKE 4 CHLOROPLASTIC n=1 Tax=Salix purpurea TaxID=77065 RepID=A0A9Q0P032_SALPP|nr:THIOREDOXIN-LIKE 4 CHLOROPLASTIC [Salix purpurea]
MDMVNRVIFSFEVLKLNRIWQKREPFFSNCNSEALNATQLMERDEETFYMPRPLSVLGRNPDRQLNCRIPCVAPSFHPCRGELSDEDDDLCPVDCVREFKTDEEFLRILEKAKETDSFSGDAAVTFLKHNVIDEYDEQSEVAERLRIKTVPLFHFYKKGVLVESFPTRDKERDSWSNSEIHFTSSSRNLS